MKKLLILFVLLVTLRCFGAVQLVSSLPQTNVIWQTNYVMIVLQANKSNVTYLLPWTNLAQIIRSGDVWTNDAGVIHPVLYPNSIQIPAENTVVFGPAGQLNGGWITGTLQTTNGLRIIDLAGTVHGDSSFQTFRFSVGSDDYSGQRIHGLFVENDVSSTNADWTQGPLYDGAGTYGLVGNTFGVGGNTKLHGIGVYGLADGISPVQIGVGALAYGLNPGNTNVGLAASVSLLPPSVNNVRVAGYFEATSDLGSAADPSYEDAVVLIDSRDSGLPLIITRSNTTFNPFAVYENKTTNATPLDITGLATLYGGAVIPSNGLSIFGSGPSSISLYDTSGVNYARISGAPTNNIIVTNYLGLVQFATASAIAVDCNQSDNWAGTNRISAATTLTVTNSAQGRTISVFLLGEASGGTDRAITIQPDAGHLIANEDTFGIPLTNKYVVTLTNGNFLEVNDSIRWMKGTNIHFLVTKQGSF